MFTWVRIEGLAGLTHSGCAVLLVNYYWFLFVMGYTLLKDWALYWTPCVIVYGCPVRYCINRGYQSPYALSGHSTVDTLIRWTQKILTTQQMFMWMLLHRAQMFPALYVWFKACHFCPLYWWIQFVYIAFENWQGE